MKNVLDVMSLQKNYEMSRALRLHPINFSATVSPALVPLYLFECATKLNMQPLTAAYGAILYHRFYKIIETDEYDEYLIAASCLYIAAKVKDDAIKIRDVINVAYNTLNRDSAPLELGDYYWSMRDSIVQAELMIARTLKFDFDIELAHKHLLYYMNTLQEWLGSEVWNSVPIARIAAAYLQDFHHSSKILKYKASHIAVGCLSLALQTYGVQVPMTDESDESSMWYQPFVKDLTKEKQWEIIEDVIEVYEIEASIKVD